MSNAIPGLSCGECKAPINDSLDPPGGQTPCPNCGSTKRVVLRVASDFVISAYTLDSFIGYKLSQLKSCDAKEIPDSPGWLNTFILKTIFQLNLDARIRAYLFSFLRRQETACDAYRQAREHLAEYISTPQNVISPYFMALSQFEICISQCYQAFELLAMLTAQKVFEHRAGSLEERLQKVYVDSKHMDQMIHGGKVPKTAPTGIWLTNSGIESARSYLSFDELHGLLTDLHALAENICNVQPPASSHVGQQIAGAQP